MIFMLTEMDTCYIIKKKSGYKLRKQFISLIRIVEISRNLGLLPLSHSARVLKSLKSEYGTGTKTEI